MRTVVEFKETTPLHGQQGYVMGVAGLRWHVYIPITNQLILCSPEHLRYSRVVRDWTNREAAAYHALIENEGPASVTDIQVLFQQAEEEQLEEVTVAHVRAAARALQEAVFGPDHRFDEVLPGAEAANLAAAIERVPPEPERAPAGEYPDAAGFAIIRKRNDHGDPVPFFGFRCWWTNDYPVPGIARQLPRYLVRVIIPEGHPDHGREIYRNYFEPDLEFIERPEEAQPDYPIAV